MTSAAEYSFEQCGADEVADAFQVYVRRIDWMNLKGLRHWNYFHYLEIFPISYFEERQRNGELFLLKNESSVIVGVGTLLTHDDGWEDSAKISAYYVHNLVTDPAVRGAGLVMMRFFYEKAVGDGKEALRLDCDVDSDFLTDYYEKLGFKLAGRCAYGPYRGFRRQLTLS